MTTFAYDLVGERPQALGLLVLQVDERIERDFRRLLPASADLFVSRVPSGADVTAESLSAQQAHLSAAAGLLPAARRYAAIGYGCTSGTAQIGRARVAELVGQGTSTRHVSEPVSALLAACDILGLRRLGFLSPYVAPVSARVRQVLAENGVQTPVFGTFAEAAEAKVARIAPGSVVAAARDLAGRGGIDAVFLSCTNLDTLDAIAPLEAETGLPVLSSNLVLAWHMCRLAGIAGRIDPGRDPVRLAMA